MKAFINKGTKIKWENSPSAPEFSDERIKQAVDAYFPVSSLEPEQGQFLMWDDSYNNWAPHTPMIDDNTDVTTNNPEDGQILVYDSSEWGNITPTLNLADDVNITSPAEGDTLVYDATAGEWKNKARETWELINTITADGTQATYEVPFSGITKPVIGIFLNINVKADANDTTHIKCGVKISGNDVDITYSGSQITTSERWGHVYIVNDNGFWRGMSLVTTSATGVGNLSEIANGWTMSDVPTTGVFIKTSNQSIKIPDGSTIEVYVKY